jgi:hypothetical protein
LALLQLAVLQLALALLQSRLARSTEHWAPFCVAPYFPQCNKVEFYNKYGALMPLLAARRHSNTPAGWGSSTSIGEFIFFSNLLYRGQLLAQESKSYCNLKTANDV